MPVITQDDVRRIIREELLRFSKSQDERAQSQAEQDERESDNAENAEKVEDADGDIAEFDDAIQDETAAEQDIQAVQDADIPRTPPQESAVVDDYPGPSKEADSLEQPTLDQQSGDVVELDQAIDAESLAHQEEQQVEPADITRPEIPLDELPVALPEPGQSAEQLPVEVPAGQDVSELNDTIEVEEAIENKNQQVEPADIQRPESSGRIQMEQPSAKETGEGLPVEVPFASSYTHDVSELETFAGQEPNDEEIQQISVQAPPEQQQQPISTGLQEDISELTEVVDRESLQPRLMRVELQQQRPVEQETNSAVEIASRIEPMIREMFSPDEITRQIESTIEEMSRSLTAHIHDALDRQAVLLEMGRTIE